MRSLERKDVVNFYNDSAYLMSGFESFIDLGGMITNGNTMDVLAGYRHDGKIYCKVLRTISCTELLGKKI